MPKPTVITSENPKWTADQCRTYLADRLSQIIDAPPDGLSFPDEHYANELRDIGNRYKAWHLEAFDRVYDLVDLNMSVATACRTVQAEFAGTVAVVSEDSFRSMFYRYRRRDEVDVRRILIVGAMFDHDMQRAVAQCMRLSRIACPRSVLNPD